MENQNPLFAWHEATSNLKPDLLKSLPQLTNILDSSDLPLAKILTGRLNIRTASTEDARELENLFLGYLADRSDTETEDLLNSGHESRATVIAWLRITYLAIKWFKSHQYDLATTRLPAIPIPDRSPFSQERVKNIVVVENWRKALFAGIKMGCHKTNTDDALAAIALSSILCGCLVEKRKLLMLVNSLQNGIELAGSLAYIDFNLPYQNNPDAQLQRWFIDPFTELILATAILPDLENGITELQLKKFISTLLVKNGCTKNQCPSSLAKLIECACIYWESRSARIDIQFMRRRFLAHSLARETWLRINHCVESKIVTGIKNAYIIKIIDDKAPANDRDDQSDSLVEDSVFGIDWYQEIRAVIAAKQLVNIKTKLSELLAIYTDDAASTYLQWLNSLLNGSSSTKNKLAESTIFRQFEIVTTLMISLIGEDNPKNWSLDDLKVVYQSLLVDYQGKHDKSVLSKGLREFQYFLSQNNASLRLKETRDLLGDEAVLSPVEARVITFDEFESAKNRLRRKVLSEDKDRVDAALLILILTFRLGLRRSEVLMILLNDFHMDGNPVLLVRPHVERRLKSTNSKRSIPLRPFMSRDELVFLNQFLHRRAVEENSFPFSSYIFALPKLDRVNIPIEATIDLIHECIRAETGDKTLHLHHLRHSFGTWTYLKLRAHDHPCIKQLFAHLPHTYKYLNNGKRLRVLLLGSSINPVRGYAFATARLLGHSGPNVSMEHYLHCSDLILWAGTVRDFEASVDTGAILSLSPIKRSGTYDYHANDLQMLMAATRKTYPSKYLLHHKIDQTATPTLKKKARGRPKNLQNDIQGYNWIPLTVIRSILHLGSQGKSSNEIAAMLSLTSSRVKTILALAENNQMKIGLKPLSLGKLACPQMPRLTEDKEFFDQIESGFKLLSTDNRQLFRKGIEIFLSHYNIKQGDVIFRSLRDMAEAKEYVEFIRRLGIPDKQIRLVVRSLETGKHDLISWQNNLGLIQADIKFIPADFSNHPAYGKWLGIQLLDSKGKGHHKAFATAIYLGSLK